jgi:isopentenyl diphosphate isomerase/L-lactate dehydrogenase-like FMN-dependent dehydrogenase
VATGAGVEETLADNREAWPAWWLRPRVLRDVVDVRLMTTMLGTEVSTPRLVAPTGYQWQVHREGGVGTARSYAGRRRPEPGRWCCLGLRRRWPLWPTPWAARESPPCSRASRPT